MVNKKEDLTMLLYVVDEILFSLATPFSNLRQTRDTYTIFRLLDFSILVFVPSFALLSNLQTHFPTSVWVRL